MMCPAKTGTDRHNVSKQTDASFFILSSVPALYQRLLRGAATYQELGNRILQQVKVAHAFRQVEQVRELARLLANIPIKEFQLIARYYLVWCKCRELEYHPDILERVADQTRTYRAQALISRAALEVYQGKVEPAVYFYTEALKANPSISDFVHASAGIAIVKSMEGFNALAIEDLERLTPLLQYAEPLVRFTTINAYAVELNETGRLSEAQAVAAKAMSSPLAPFYPELQETWSGIKSKGKRRSTITLSGPRFEQAESEVPDSLIDRDRVEAVLDFMNANLHRRIALPELGRVVNLSGSHVSRIFKSEMGVAPITHLIRLRLEKAAKLLTTTFLSVKQVMASVGYGNRHTFLYQFHRHFDLTPTEYRKRFFHRR